MDFRIADTFTDSLGRLANDEQKAIKMTAFDLQMDPSRPGLQFHKLDGAKDRDFWSVRVSRDIRIIIHRTQASLTLCYVDHHDQAYRWAEQRKLETHPKTHAAQLVEVREAVQEVTIPVSAEMEQPAQPKPPLLVGVPEKELLGYGVPVDWLADVRGANEDTLLELCGHLPNEAAEALLELAVGGRPQRKQPVAVVVDPFDHPDAQRRFRVMANREELERALDFPWDKWSVFLHPVQREVVERDFGGPARVSGSAGTGKTVVVLHRAVHLARANLDARVLLATFSDTLANFLREKLRILTSSEPRLAERVEVHSVDAIAKRLYRRNFGEPVIASQELTSQLLGEAVGEGDATKFAPQFLMAEWEQVVDDWQLETWEAYRDVLRRGRRRQLQGSQRQVLWSVFERIRSGLRSSGQITRADMFGQLTSRFGEGDVRPFDFVLVDEAQDVGVAQLRFLAALGSGNPNGLFFAGDLGQRIFQQPFSWKALGLDIQGRSQTLRINYRTSHQIRAQADRLLDNELSDVDGNTEDRRGTLSVFNGPRPAVRVCDSADHEAEAVSEWLRVMIEAGLKPEEIAVFVRSEDEMPRATSAVKAADLPPKVIVEQSDMADVGVSVSTMHLAKGLEFRAVAVIACDDEVIPLQERIESIADESELEEVYNTERHLLYVACTRARDHLLVTGVDPASEFLSDLVTRAAPLLGATWSKESPESEG